MRNAFVRIVFWFVIVMFFAGAACANPPTPLLWKVSKAGSTVYLLGSMHMLKRDDYPLSPDVEAAYKDAEKIVLEVAPDELTSPATVALTLQHGMYHDAAHGLQDDLPAGTWQKLIAYGAKNNLPAVALQRFEPWMAALTIVAIESQKMGLKPDDGLDMHFAKMAVTDHKPTAGLETVDYQLAIFYTASLKTQQDMLQQGLDEIADFAKDMSTEHDAWRRGDGNTLFGNAKREFADYPELYQKIVAQRNRNWLPLIEKMLVSGSDDTLVIVGALHLLGPDGVVHLLQRKGYTVERICSGCRNIH